jgi:hypothetical protein
MHICKKIWNFYICQNLDPPLKNKLGLFIIFLLIAIQNIGILATWIIITTYIKMYIFVIVLLILAVQFILLRFNFGLNSKEREYNAFIDGVPYEELESESSRIFWTAILTSWVSTTTVWSNNIINKCSLKELETKTVIKRPSIQQVFENCFLFFLKRRCSKDVVIVPEEAHSQTSPPNCCQCFQCTRYSDNNIFMEETQTYKNRSKILFTSGLATNIILAGSFIIIFIAHKTAENLFFSIEENLPFTRCLQLLPNLTSGHFKMSALLLRLFNKLNCPFII